MKVLIWIGCYMIATFLNVLLGMATGVRLGYLLFYLVFTFAARSLCRAWDQFKENRNMKDYQKNKQIKEKENAPASVPPIYTARATPESPSAARPNFCRKCGFRLRENSRFCSRCGEQILQE